MAEHEGHRPGEAVHSKHVAGEGVNVQGGPAFEPRDSASQGDKAKVNVSDACI